MGLTRGSEGAGEHKILYDDKELEWVFLVLQTVHWLSQDATLVDGGATPAKAAAAATAVATGSGGRRRRLEADLLVDALHTPSGTDQGAGASEVTAADVARKRLRPQREKTQPEEKGPTAMLPGGCDVACGDVKGYLLPGGRRGDEWVRLKVRRRPNTSRVSQGFRREASTASSCRRVHCAWPPLRHSGAFLAREPRADTRRRSWIAPSTTRAAPPRW